MDWYISSTPLFSSQSASPEFNLAMGVFIQAVRDVLDIRLLEKESHVYYDAARFLVGGADFDWWCDVLHIDPSIMKKGLDRIIKVGMQQGFTYTIQHRRVIPIQLRPKKESNANTKVGSFG